MFDVIGMLDEDIIRESQEEPGANHTWDPTQARFQFAHVIEEIDLAVEDPVAVVGHERLLGSRLLPHSHLAHESVSCQLALTERPSEGHDLDRQFATCPEGGDELFRADENDEPLGSRGHDLFSQQGTAVAFDEVQVRVDFVRTIDREVQAIDLFEINQRDTKLACESFRFD
jgi:hypothetical protein